MYLILNNCTNGMAWTTVSQQDVELIRERGIRALDKIAVEWNGKTIKASAWMSGSDSYSLAESAPSAGMRLHR